MKLFGSDVEDDKKRVGSNQTNDVDKIEYLVNWINSHLPEGCANLDSCDGCPLADADIDDPICDMLERLSRSKHED